MPAEDMPAAGHLGSLEGLVQADGTLQFLLGMVQDLPYLVPFLLLNSLKVREGLKFFGQQFAGVEGKAESTHEAILAVFLSISR